ncbi:T9SS type A sorting domain-containing protein [Flavobacterium rivuli]|uniref:T9SS type A sorting domain-containing protein n=1 Tax=Flavobacterium rivuli TaxID=498301 RepID=UPI0003AA3D11|nr:T9SS type A sorting domain-containing protein [Flavobacterium rivuli]
MDGHTLWLKSDLSNDIALAKVKNDPETIKATHFNFNKVLDLENLKNKLYKNVVEERYSFFAVFKSDTDQEESLININKGKTTTFITNKEVLTDLEMPYKKVDSKKGIILSFVAAIDEKGKKNNSIAIEDIFTSNEDGKHQLMEVIYYPRILSRLERQKVETYLSIKFGLSIVGDFNYTNTANDTIWDFKKNKVFNKRVTGIGRDDASGLYQKQSGNAEKDGIYIGLGIIDTTNAGNKNTFDNNTFLLWGDSGESTSFNKSKKNDDIKVMKRLWKMQCFFKESFHTINTQVRINKSEIAFTGTGATDSESIWLAINDDAATTFNYGTARYIKQSNEDEEFIYFNDVAWDLDNDRTDIFTFIKGPDFFFEADALTDCSLPLPGAINVAIAGGKPPYEIAVTSKAVSKKQIITRENYGFISLPADNYTVTVTDSKKNSKTLNISLDRFADINLSLKSTWYLGNNKQVQVSAITPENIQTKFTYKWLKDGEIHSADEQFTAVQTGDYLLKIANNNGCEKEFPFKVLPAANVNSGWTAYPNPTKASQPFYIRFNLNKEAKVTVKINSMEGKSYVVKDLGLIKEYTYTDSLLTAGVYLITATINNIDEAVKLIIE